MADFCVFYDVISFAHFIRILEDLGYKFKTNTRTFPTDDVSFSITVEFWKE